MMSPKLILVIFVIQYIRQSEQVNCQSSGNCDVAENDLEITCPKYPLGGACTCKPTGKCDVLTYNTLDLDTCKTTKCQEESCVFWKYIITGVGPTATKSCYLMNENQCQSEDPNVSCPDNYPTCRSGHNEDGSVTCDHEFTTTIAPPPTTESPFKGTCPGPIDRSQNDPLKHYQKWDCWKPGGANGHPEQWDMYTETSMPTGGYCDLIPDATGSCKVDNYRYSCDGVDAENSAWNGPDNTNDLNSGILKEIGCQATSWVPQIQDQTGRRFSCVNGGINSEGKIPAENDCIMLCDNYPVFSFFTDFKDVDDVTRVWFYELIDNPGSKGELIQGMLDCWGKK